MSGFMNPADAGRAMAQALHACRQDGTFTEEEYEETVRRASTATTDPEESPMEAWLEAEIVAAFIAEHGRITA
jgi:hypothetical protein